MSNGIRSLIKTDKAVEHFETAKREVPYIVNIAMKFKYIRRNQSVVSKFSIQLRLKAASPRHY